MRSPSKSVSKREKDAEAALNLPPGFRFHPTDDELVVHYLCPKAAGRHQHEAAFAGVSPPPPIIAEVDLYKHDPWDLPAMALFGTKEWYFFTPRDRKYPNGSRPNRAAGNGYWKATGADKPIRPKSNPNKTVGIKKALVFYAGKGAKGIKTNWIMHEYRLAKPGHTSCKNTQNATTHKLDDWVLCRLYNKKNNPDEKILLRHDNHEELQKGNSSNNSSGAMESLNSCEESDAEVGSTSVVDDQEAQEDEHEHEMLFAGNLPPQTLTTKVNDTSQQNNRAMKLEDFLLGDEDDSSSYAAGNEWLIDLSLEDMQHYLEAIPCDPFQGVYQMPTTDHFNQPFLRF